MTVGGLSLKNITGLPSPLRAKSSSAPHLPPNAEVDSSFSTPARDAKAATSLHLLETALSIQEPASRRRSSRRRGSEQHHSPDEAGVFLGWLQRRLNEKHNVAETLDQERLSVQRALARYGVSVNWHSPGPSGLSSPGPKPNASHGSSHDGKENIGFGKTSSRKIRFETIMANPHHILYTNPTILDCFCCGRSVESTTMELTSGVTSVKDIPPIRVFQRDGKLLTLDHRRLFAFRAALPLDAEIQVKLLPPDTVIGQHLQSVCLPQNTVCVIPTKSFSRTKWLTS